MSVEELKNREIKAIIGLGNPGPRFVKHRHNIGFRVVDALVDRCAGSWKETGTMLLAQIEINGKPVLVIKPSTFMNSSGEVFPYLAKKGIKAENILVVHDELEKPFGSMAFKLGGSHRGHNGLRSLIDASGADFARLRFGIGRPERKEDVPDYVLSNFNPQEQEEIDTLIEHAASSIETLF
jgi:PTH1 family peptidyl-tRNA hydrolase